MSISVTNKVYTYFWSLVFGESLKLESVWDQSVNMKFNVFYSTFTNVFLFLSRFFTFFNVFYFDLKVFYIYAVLRSYRYSPTVK